MQQKSLKKFSIFIRLLSNRRFQGKKQFDKGISTDLVSNALQILRSTEHNPKHQTECGTRNCTYFLSSTVHMFACTVYYDCFVASTSSNAHYALHTVQHIPFGCGNVRAVQLCGCPLFICFVLLRCVSFCFLLFVIGIDKN